ncbi:protein terminal ear1-like [Melia azedarach]|uniref:Protein terminal ear1-like n=1 Tax=Melia azedarach TaxID=155640 RepID=A0ACC1WRS3_MELAZ|nr:protein terminal ear1-like [Melia azedarach]
MCQIPVMASPSSPPPPPTPSPKLLNPQPQTQSLTHAPSPPQPTLKFLNPQVQASTLSPKLLNPHAQPFTPLWQSESQRRAILVPRYLIEQQQQQCLYTLAPVMTRCFVFQPRPVWSPHQAGVEYYNAFQQPLQGNVVTYYGEKEVAGEENVEEYGKKKMDQRVKRIVPPRLRLQGKSNVLANGNKIWAPMKSDENTTLMIKNIPNQLQRFDIMRILDDHCREENRKGKYHPDPCRSEYDFVYLPMDFGYRANLGYAFVNFTTAAGATRFSKAFHKFAWDAQVPGSKKICQVSRAAIQGKNALIDHFELSKFHCHTDDYLPATLSPPRDGWKNTSPSIVGKRIGTGPAVAIQRRKCILMLRNKRLPRSFHQPT